MKRLALFGFAVLLLASSCSSDSQREGTPGNSGRALEQGVPYGTEILPSGRPSAGLAEAERARDGAAFAQPPRLGPSRAHEAAVQNGEDLSPADGTEALGDMAIDVKSYTLSGRFDWQTRLLHATVAIKLVLRSDGGDVLVLDSSVKEIETVRLVTRDGVTLLPFVVDRGLGTLSISKLDLPPELQRAGATLNLEIAYKAAANTARAEDAGLQTRSTLHAVGDRADDPIAARVVYTTAEPLGAATWMPCHNVPSDRAAFRTTLTMPVQERLIANGRLVTDTVDQAAGLRTTSYATDYELPTYLMALAMGDFQVTEVQRGALPLSIWARRGLRLDSEAMLSAIGEMMETFEELLIPYPFEKYAVVLLPQFPAGGIEHASISFQTENRTTAASMRADYSLTAHELAHQWFGDLVTVATWDDLWIKEGMATLLAAESMMRFEDRREKGVLPGLSFGFVAGEALRDTALPPGEKYSSGPYGRSAWTFNQLRSATGDELFWQIMRDILREHAWGSVGTQQVIDAFAPHLSSDAQAAFVRAIDDRSVPQFKARASGFALEDPGSSLIVPLEFRLVSEDGSVDVRQLRAGGLLTNNLLETKGRLVVFDPRGVHPMLDAFGSEGPRLLGDRPGLNLAELERVASLGPVALGRTLREVRLLLTPSDGSEDGGNEADAALWNDRFRALVAASGSDSVAFGLVEVLCRSGQSDSAQLDNRSVLGASLLETLTYRGQALSAAAPGKGALAGCVSEDRLKSLAAEVRRAALSRYAEPDRLMLLRYLVPATGDHAQSWVDVAMGMGNLRLRATGLQALSDGLAAEASQGLLGQDSARLEVWSGWINALLGNNSVPENLWSALDLARAYHKLGSTDAGPATTSLGLRLKPGLVRLFGKGLPPAAAERALCQAKTLLGDEAWRSMLLEVQSGPNGAAAARLMRSPDTCSPP